MERKLDLILARLDLIEDKISKLLPTEVPAKSQSELNEIAQRLSSYFKDLKSQEPKEKEAKESKERKRKEEKEDKEEKDKEEKDKEEKDKEEKDKEEKSKDKEVDLSSMPFVNNIANGITLNQLVLAFKTSTIFQSYLQGNIIIASDPTYQEMVDEINATLYLSKDKQLEALAAVFASRIRMLALLELRERNTYILGLKKYTDCKRLNEEDINLFFERLDEPAKLKANILAQLREGNILDAVDVDNMLNAVGSMIPETSRSGVMNSIKSLIRSPEVTNVFKLFGTDKPMDKILTQENITKLSGLVTKSFKQATVNTSTMMNLTPLILHIKASSVYRYLLFGYQVILYKEYEFLNDCGSKPKEERIDFLVKSCLGYLKQKKTELDGLEILKVIVVICKIMNFEDKSMIIRAYQTIEDWDILEEQIIAKFKEQEEKEEKDEKEKGRREEKSREGERKGIEGDENKITPTESSQFEVTITAKDIAVASPQLGKLMGGMYINRAVSLFKTTSLYDSYLKELPINNTEPMYQEIIAKINKTLELPKDERLAILADIFATKLKQLADANDQERDNYILGLRKYTDAVALAEKNVEAFMFYVKQQDREKLTADILCQLRESNIGKAINIPEFLTSITTSLGSGDAAPATKAGVTLRSFLESPAMNQIFDLITVPPSTTPKEQDKEAEEAEEDDIMNVKVDIKPAPNISHVFGDLIGGLAGGAIFDRAIEILQKSNAYKTYMSGNPITTDELIYQEIVDKINKTLKLPKDKQLEALVDILIEKLEQLKLMNREDRNAYILKLKKYVPNNIDESVIDVIFARLKDSKSLKLELLSKLRGETKPTGNNEMAAMFGTLTQMLGSDSKNGLGAMLGNIMKGMKDNGAPKPDNVD